MLRIFLGIGNSPGFFLSRVLFSHQHNPVASCSSFESFKMNFRSNLSITGCKSGISLMSILSLMSFFGLDHIEPTGLADAIITVGDLILAFIPCLFIVNSPSSITSNKKPWSSGLIRPISFRTHMDLLANGIGPNLKQKSSFSFETMAVKLLPEACCPLSYLLFGTILVASFISFDLPMPGLPTSNTCILSLAIPFEIFVFRRV